MPLAWFMRSGAPEEHCMDVVYLALTIAFFALSWALIVACERLS